MKLTYIGIGAANNSYQQLPKYLVKYSEYFNFRVIIIDPIINSIPDLLIDSNNFFNKQLLYENKHCDLFKVT